jgi:hypothetical protein
MDARVDGQCAASAETESARRNSEGRNKMLDNDGGFTTSVPTVPSREAVEAYFKRGPKDGMFTAWVAEGHAMLRALYAEVERLNEDKESYRRTANELAERVAKAEIDRDDLRATVAEQGAALAVVVAEMDKAIDVQGEGARSTTAASVPIHMVQRWRHALGGFAALASAQSSVPR